MDVITFTLRSPTCISTRPTSPGQLTATLSYLTGTVVRGALASLLLRGRRLLDDGLPDDERELFVRLMLSGELRFGNAWPSPGQATDKTWLVPRTAWSHKRNGGWLGGKDPGAGVVDALADLLHNGADKLVEHGCDRFEAEFACESGTSWEGLKPARRLISRTALTRNETGLPPITRGVAADGQLYSFEALETGQSFLATIDGPADLRDELRKALPRSFTVGLGQGRSRGMGQARAQLLTLPDPPARDPDRLARQAREFTQRADRADRKLVYLPVTLLADTILRDDYLLPCASGDPRVTLARYTAEPPPPSMVLHTAVQSTRWAGGWDELRRLPRQPMLAVEQGSVWVYAVPDADADLAAAIAWWLAVERAGVGERRGEGFGRLMLLHPFHAEEKVR